MTRFEHLSVLISIILGLGIAQLLTNLHSVVRAQPNVRSYWLTWLWAVLIFVGQVEWWWSSFSFQEMPLEDWTFFYFLFVLLSPVTLYLASASALPEVTQGQGVDLREFYYRRGGWFFLMASLGLVFDAVRRGMTTGNVLDVGVITNVVGAGLVGSLGLSDREWHHAILTVAIAAIFLYFILSAALTLG